MKFLSDILAKAGLTVDGVVTFNNTATGQTPATNDNSTKLATTAFIKNQSYLTANQTITVSGDATGSGTTSIALTLANSGVTAGTYGNASNIPTIVVDSKGRITSITTNAVSIITTLAGLSDVTLTSPSTNQVLQYNGTRWVNGPAPTTYTLPIASASVLGGIKVGSGLSIDSVTGVLSASGTGGNVNFKSIQEFTATAGQTTFTIAGGYTAGYIDVLVNGVYLSASQYTATDLSTIVLTDPSLANDLITVFLYSLYNLGSSNYARNISTLTATAGQTVFTTSYIPGQIDIYYNGSKLSSSEFIATNGSSITLSQAAALGDILEVVTYLAGAGLNASRSLTINGVTYDLSADRSWTITNASLGAQPQLNGTGLVRMSGTTVTYDNASYATQSYVTTAIANLVNAAPSTLDTLNELAAALGNDASFSTTVTNSIANKLALSGGTLTGNLIGNSGFEILNGQFYKARRNSGSLLTDMIGIPSGTDDVRILTTGDFNVINGSLTNILAVKNNGSVGIGTNLPSLHSSTTGLVVKGSARGIIELWDATSGKSVFQNVGGDTYIGQLDKGLGTGKLILLVNGNGTSADAAITMLANGNVGISTSTPTTLFDARLATTDSVNGSVLNSYPIASFIANASGGGTRGLQIGAPTGSIVSPVFLKVFGTSQRFSILDASNVENFTISGGYIGMGVNNPTFPLDLLTVTSGAFKTIAQFQNTDYTTGNQSFIRVRQWVNAGGSSSSYFGTGQDSNLYIIANNSARGGDLIINAGTGAATFSNTVTATSLIKSGGTSSQFLKADGSVDNNGYSPIISSGFALQGGVSYNGWVRIAITSLNSGGYGPRGGFKITVANTGNYLNPAQDTIYGYKDWGNTVFINRIDSYLTTTFTQYRITTDANYSYLEGYVNWTPGGDQSIAVYSETNGHNGLQWTPATGYAVSGLSSPSSSDTVTRLASGSSFRNLYITNNVGIGTVSGNRKLTISKDTEGVASGIELRVVGGINDGNNDGIFFTQGSAGATPLGSIRAEYKSSGYPDIAIYTRSAASVETNRFSINGSSGYVYLGKSWNATNHRINLEVSQGNNILVISAYSGASNDTAIFYAVSGSSPNSSATALGVMTNSSTGRSINAGGTINASGNDYAEYMTKAVTDLINKGDIVGVDANGLLTNIFADSVSFVVKSTDPSYVGGDSWGNQKRPERTIDQTEEEFAPILAQFEIELEEKRTKVDRISFSGQVPVNVYNAQVGDYIVPIELIDGKIGGEAITTPTFEQYQKAVGKVWKIMEDGRAWIAVKIG